jgi:hypothetical protein
MDRGERKHLKRLRTVCERIDEKFEKISNLHGFVHAGFNRLYKNKPVLTLLLAILFFVAIALFDAAVHVGVHEWYYQYHESPDQEGSHTESEQITPTQVHHLLTHGDGGYVRIWEPCTSQHAPDKGWLVVENPYYRLSINLDHSYYTIFDKVKNRDILVYNDAVSSEIDILTACDLGFADHDGDNSLAYASTALYDSDGLEYEFVYEDAAQGFLMINTRGWDTYQKETGKGYDVEAEVIFGIFADRPYFINAVELVNLQKAGYTYPNAVTDPDEIVQSWVLIDEYRTTSMRGGDNTHRDLWGPPLLHNLTTIGRIERKPWHVGSAAFSQMFPTHILLGDKIGGGVIFSLPEGTFRFDDRLGVYGDQVVGEFIINVDKPQNAIAFTVNPVNELLFFYDFEEFNTVAGYPDLMRETCERYGLEYPNGTLDAHQWQTKHYAYVVTLVDQWYDAENTRVSEATWALADGSLADFYRYQSRIHEELVSTDPLTSR